MAERRCRIHSCKTLAKAGQLMCRDHWLSLPAMLRRSINASWKARDMKSYVAEVRAAEKLILGEPQT